MVPACSSTPISEAPPPHNTGSSSPPPPTTSTKLAKTASFVSSLWTRLNNSSSSSSGLSGSSKTFCRICHEDDSFDALISPCKCSGTSGMIHKWCLEKWLSSSNHDSCEICRFQFRIRRRPRTLGEVATAPWTQRVFVLLPLSFFFLVVLHPPLHL